MNNIIIGLLVYVILLLLFVIAWSRILGSAKERDRRYFLDEQQTGDDQ